MHHAVIDALQGQRLPERMEGSSDVLRPAERGRVAGDDGRNRSQAAKPALKLRVETRRRLKDFEALAEAWDALAAVQIRRTPFQNAAWSRLWWKHYQRDAPQIRDELRLYAIRDAAGQLVAIAPMMITHRPARLPIRTRELQFLGADSNITEIRGMICQPGAEAAALDALLRHLAVQDDWDWVQWRGIPGPQAPSIPGFRTGRILSNFYLDLPGSWDELRAGLPRNMKEALRKCYNSLARANHAFTFDVIAAPDAIMPALQRLLGLHSLRAEREDTVVHPNVFASREARAFITDYVQEAAAAGSACIFALTIGGVPVAMRLGFVSGDELYLYYSGYDPEWGRYSVMTTVVAEAMKWAIGRGLRRVNLSTGSDPSKLRWRPDQVDFIEGIQPAKHWRAHLALAAMNMMRHRLTPLSGLADARMMALLPKRPARKPATSRLRRSDDPPPV